MGDLENYRTKIDQIDPQIIELLVERFEVVKKVGMYKKEHNLPPLQPARWQEVLDSKKKLAEEKGISSKYIENIWNEIHEYALTLEK